MAGANLPPLIRLAAPRGRSIASLLRCPSCVRFSPDRDQIADSLVTMGEDRPHEYDARGVPHAVHFTLRFSAEVFPLFATSSYWTC
jgi:hypothetical protein